MAYMIQTGMDENPPVLSSDIIHVWVADLVKALPHAENYFKILSGDEKKKASDYKFEKDRQRYTAARGILRKLLSVYSGDLPERIEFLYNESGKPYLTQSDLKFNLSHSGNLAVYAFTADREIGIDMEYKRNLENLESLAVSTLSEAELKNFSTCPYEKREEFFFRYWIHKEAYLKAAGTGITDSIRNAEFIDDMNGNLKLAENSDAYMNKNWTFCEIFPEENYRAVLAAPDENFKIFLNRLENYNI